MDEKDLKNIFKMSKDKLRKTVTQANLSLHERYAEVYDMVHPQQCHPYYQKKLLADLYEIAAFVARYKPLNGIRVLDLGSGTGFLTFHLAGIADFDFTCVDISGAMLEKQKEKLADLNKKLKVRLVKEDVISFCNHSKEKFDMVTMSAFLHHVFNIEEVLRAVMKCVNDRGVVYIAFEPLKDANMDEHIYRIHCILREMDNLLWKWKNKEQEEMKYDDLTLADFHTIQGGIHPKSITQILEENGFHVHVGTFYVRYDENLAWFGDAILGARNTFSILAKKG